MARSTSYDAQASVPGIVFNIQRFSIHDGPGIRTSVFLKGCPMRCPWCHNPESISPDRQIAGDMTRCIECHLCVEACSRTDGPRAAGPVPAGDDCTLCGECAEACPSTARTIVGREVTPLELLAELVRDRVFYDQSGGGITFSGGEPLAQPDFVIESLEECKREDLHTAVDTCGFRDRETLISVAELTDLFLFDLKTIDPALHLRLTGVEVAPVLENLELLAAHGARIWLRIPIVPGLTDRTDTIDSAVAYAKRHSNIERISLLPYHRTGLGKQPRLGLVEPSNGFKPPSEEVLQRLAADAAASGVTVTVGA